MAKVDIKLPDEFQVRLSKLGDRFDAIAQKVLIAGAEPVFLKAKSNLASVIGKNLKTKSRSRGELLASLGISPPKRNRDGNWDIKVGIGNSIDSHGVSNALKGMVLEYGKHGQPPKPWLKPAKSAAKKASIQAMQDKFEKEIGNL